MTSYSVWLDDEPIIESTKITSVGDKYIPKVYNRHHKNAPMGSVYIGRGTPFGNPYIVGKDGDVGECCDKYIADKSKDEEFIAMVKRELKGKNLVCSCKPRRCHGDWLIEVANS